MCGRRLVAAKVDGEDRLRCPEESCGFVLWDNPVPVVAGIIEHQDNVLLVRNKGWPENWWGLCTGFLERGETVEEGMVREVAEELGLEAMVRSLVGVYSFVERNQVIIAYHLTADGPITVGDELAGYKAVPISKLRPWDSATGHAVRDWLAQRRQGR